MTLLWNPGDRFNPKVPPGHCFMIGPLADCSQMIGRVFLSRTGRRGQGRHVGLQLN